MVADSQGTMLMCKVLHIITLKRTALLQAAENMQQQQFSGVDTPAPALPCMSAASLLMVTCFIAKPTCYCSHTNLHKCTPAATGMTLHLNCKVLLIQRLPLEG